MSADGRRRTAGAGRQTQDGRRRTMKQEAPGRRRTADGEAPEGAEKEKRPDRSGRREKAPKIRGAEIPPGTEYEKGAQAR